MTETETQHQEEAVIEQPPITPIHTDDCPSLSGRSTLTFAIGRHDHDKSLHLRIVSNDGGGMFFEGWASGEQIDAIVKGGTELTAKSFHALHPGRSINTGGFVLACLKHLGLIRANAENTRLHEHVPTMTFEKVALLVMGLDAAPAKSRKTLSLQKKG